eukprot:CAMPEP_0172608446 /NCGR_PEP_ID=MMETSP1068-20121228/28530_1 /TAXON_ID=35684 /ORGANISM="Pseudopedinella elastica, Strain CCMP716" /LENGTH=338 /DNA_ID=CAMNT_0013411721 /DNA_START=86 /DNA_END=1102 /DNA_ORIENTATION=+
MSSRRWSGDSDEGDKELLLDDLEASKPPVEREPPLKAVVDGSSRIFAAVFYAIASFGTVFVMKIVLTVHGFPSALFLGLSQFILTTVVFAVLGTLGYVEIAKPSVELVLRVVPLTLIYLLNVVSGLGGTKEISLPMFTVLRRFSILFTMLLEAHVFRKAVSMPVKLSVGLMILGAIVAASSDLSFNGQGYTLILINDACTAAYGVCIRFFLANHKMTQNSLLLYNSALGAMGLGAFMCVAMPDELQRSLAFHEWGESYFYFLFFSAAAAGCILNYAIFLCTSRNSALTTTVIGCLKNVGTSYIGMIVGGDYVFSYLNFAGLNLSIVGSLVYSYITFKG